MKCVPQVDTEKLWVHLVGQKLGSEVLKHEVRRQTQKFILSFNAYRKLNVIKT